ncbi:MAG: NAD(P)/FAD-dependent oxidoreductase, partial [Bacteroidota bacterium]
AGGGPGGVTAALCLAEAGIPSTILEKSSFPRDKVCGDALSGKVVSVLHYGLPHLEEGLHAFPEKVGSWGIRFVAPSLEALDVPFQSKKAREKGVAPGYIAKRWEFDHWLMEQAQAHPLITVKEGVKVEAVEVKADKVLVHTGQQQWEAKVIIGAEGAHSVVAKQLGGIRMEPAHHSAGIRAYYQGVTGFHPQNFIELHYLKELLPGYFWIFPLPNGWANVGLGMLSRDVSKERVNLKARLLEIVSTHPQLKERFSGAQLMGKIQGFGLPLGSKKRNLSGNRFVLVGDAASLIDPFSGEGIGNAMLSGRIAAERIGVALSKGDFSADFFASYDEAVYRKVWSELRLSHQMQKLVNYPWLFNFVVKKVNRNEALQSMFTMMFEDLDIRQELRKPSFYWKLFTGG